MVLQVLMVTVLNKEAEAVVAVLGEPVMTEALLFTEGAVEEVVEAVLALAVKVEEAENTLLPV